MTPSTPIPALAGRCFLVPDFLSPEECRELVAASEAGGFTRADSDYPPSYRNNDRHVIDSEALAARLGTRLAEYAPATVELEGQPWHYAGLNERLRYCRYQAGQRFNLHQDGVHHRGAGLRSHLTFLVYLSGGERFEGGDTVFYAHGPRGCDGGAPELGRVRPAAGSLLLFEHDLWHAGAEVHAGTKHVLRSDVLYRAAADDAHAGADGEHRGYVWTLAALDGQHCASAGRDASIRIRDTNGKPVRQLLGHAQSVLGLAPLPGGRLASVSRDRTLRVWDWANGACEVCVPAHASAVLDVVALPDGRLATSGADGLVKLWRQDGCAAGSLAGHEGWVWQLATMEDGHIASASEDGSVRIWDSASLRCVAVLPGEQPLRSLLVVDDTLWTGDMLGRVTCWRDDGDGWRRAAQFTAHGAAVRRLRRVGDGLVASAGEDCALRVWNVATRVQAFEARHDNFVTDALHLCGTLLSSSYDGRILRHPVPV